MTAIGMGVSFLAYSIGMWGYCLIRGYDVPFLDLFKSTWPGVQANVTAPAQGHKLGTINNSTNVT